jgi:hypothetical protein
VAPAASPVPSAPSDGHSNNAAFSWTPEVSPTGPVSIIVSGRDRRIVVLRNGKQIGSAPVMLDVPVANTEAFTLRAVDADDADGRRSITLVKVVESFERFSLLDVTIKTGRTHQIRVHLLHEGHAIAGDDKYGDFAANRALARGESVPGVRFDRMFLHARSLRFAHPASGETIELQAALPSECLDLLQQLAMRERQPPPGPL